jgi:predicted AlkP superfamily pyrophosphatase or phosphodiesterase
LQRSRSSRPGSSPDSRVGAAERARRGRGIACPFLPVFIDNPRVTERPGTAVRLVAALVGLVVALAVVHGRPAAGSQSGEPILILVSLDGWRWDYLERSQAPHVGALARRGVRAEGLVPLFPSKTFPNHYTIVTGLTPDHHGIISNNMRDDRIGERFSLGAPTLRDPRWWSGEPIWTTAIRQGRRAMAMFWPGSDVEIGGVRPTAYRPFDDDVPNEARVRQVLDWLALPERERPSFVTIYFSTTDTAGHDHGPDSAEVLDAARLVDRSVGQLVDGVSALGLSAQTTFVVVSDHGMSALAPERTIYLDDYVDLATVDVVDWSPVLQIAPRSGSVDDLYGRLAERHPALAVYRREALPRHFRFGSHPRVPPVVAIADDGWRITSRPRAAERPVEEWARGDHGFDGRYRSMHGLFVAAGPLLRQSLVVPAFENVHLYEFMCRVLGITPARHDGDRGETARLFR